MFHRFLLYLTCLSLFLGMTSHSLSAQPPCADTQPTIAGAQIVCNNQLGVIYSTPNIPGHTYSWSVTGGIIVSGGGTNQVSVTWGPVGAGSLSVTETNPSIPCFTTVTKAIKVQPLLISYLYYTNTSCYGDSLSFVDRSVADPSKPIVDYFINYGDGNSQHFATAPNPVGHIYAGPPYNITYSITYIVTNSEGMTDTIYDAVYVNPNQFIPTAAFTYTLPNCSYDPVSFNGTISTNPPGASPFKRYAWDFGDPASGSANFDSCLNCGLVTHLFTGPGTYNVTLSVLNTMSCRNSVTQQVVIGQSVPTAAYSFSFPTCQNNPVSFTDNSTFPAGKDIVTWEWYFGDGTVPVIRNAPASPNVSHVFPGLGPYTVELRVISNAGCIDSAYHSVTLTPSPIADFTYSTPCVGDTMHFQNHSQLNNGPAIVYYDWDFGDPASGNNSSNQANGTHVYNNPGTYTVRLAIANTTGCPDTIRKSFIVNPRPAAEFTWNVGSMNNQIAFHIDSTITNLGAIGYMCQWNFGDGTYGVGHNPIHTYLGSNNWTVTLTVTDTLGCSGSISHVVYVPEIPMAFYSSNSPVCLNTPMCFTDLSSVPSPPFGFIASWTWDFGDGSPTVTINFPNNPNVCHTYANPGIYLVTLSVTDNSGFTDSYSHNQTVLPLPIANFFWSTPCKGKLVQFTDASFPNGGGNVISWDWNFGDPLSGSNNIDFLQNPSHIFTDSGYFNVRLIIHNFDNCVDTIIKPVYVFPSPPVDFTRDTACLGDLVHFFANTTITHIDSIVTWSWDFGDGTAISTDAINTSHLYTAPGIYICTLSVVDLHGCTNSVSHQVKVNPKPIPEFSWSSPACSSSVIHFTDQSSVPAGYTGYVARWLWDFGDGTTQLIIIPASPNVTHVFPTTSNSYVVRLTVWSSDSCSLFKEHTVTLIPSPIAGFDYSPVTCQGQAVQFNDLSQSNGGGSVTQWHWNFGDPTSGNNLSTIPSPTHTYAVAGLYTVTLIIQNATGCMDTTVQTITVNQLPLADFHADTACFNTLTTFTNFSVPNAGPTGVIISYLWDFGDGSAPVSMQNPTHLYLTYGVFNVKLTIVNSNGCTKDTVKQVLVNPLPIPEFSFTSPNCFGAVVCYTDLSHTVSGYLGSIVKWVWDFNDGTIVTVNFPGTPNVCHTFAGNVLSHTVRLTIKTSDSCTAFIDHVVNSIPAPVADFGYSSITCANQLVQFTDFSQNNGGGSIISWNWNFGDPLSGGNNIATSQNPAHSFSGPGPHIVTMIVKNTDGCQDTIWKTVDVSLLPVADFTADTACLGSVTTFTNASAPPLPANIISYSWDFGDGLPGSSLQNPTHIYSTYGIKTVTLTVVNSNGCVKDTSKQILVNPLPIAAFTYTTPNCLGSVVQFTNQSTTVVGYLGSIVRWHWDFGDNTSITIFAPGNPNVSHTFSGAIAHTVRLTITTSDSCTSFIEHVVNSMPSPQANFSFPTSNCAQQCVLFTDLSQFNGGGNITQWHWDFGDPASGVGNTTTSQNPCHTFSAPGVYTVTEIVYNATNCSDISIQTVTIITLPLINFLADTICLGTLTTFTFDPVPGSIGTIAQYLWDFGDGVTSPLASPTHLYLIAGVYNVTLTVTTTEGCVNHITKAVPVWAAPVASFMATAPTCAGDSVHFTDLSSTPHGVISTWDWTFGDGGTGTGQNVSHFYTTGGTYPVTLTITTSDGCIATKTIQVVIQPAPLAAFTYATILCAQMPVLFTDLSQSGGGSAINQWLWNFGDPSSGLANTSTVKNPTHNFTHSGTFNVNLMVTTASGCFDSINKPVTVNAAPVAKFSADTACVGSLTQFNDESVANSASIASWLWDFGEPSSGTNNNSTLQNPTHNYGAPGLYTVRLTVTNSNSCEHDTTMQISVNPRPQAMFSASVSCVGDSTAFTDLSIAPGSGVSAWLWDFGDGSPGSSIQNPKHVYTTANTFNVKLRVTNLANCVDSIVIPVTTRPKPVAAYTYTNFFCPAGQVIFQDQSQGTGAAIVQREWIFMPGSTSSLINPTFIFPVRDTTYFVTLIVTDNNGCMDTVSDSVYVKPAFAFTFRNDTVCFKNPTHFTAIDLAKGDSLYNVSWNFGDPSSGPFNNSLLFSPQHTFTNPGIFVVKLKATNSDNCTDSVFREVTVHSLPAPAFSVISLPCDSVIHFRDSTLNSGSTIASWEWNFGDGSPVVTIPGTFGSGDTSHIYLAQGVYPVTLKVTNSFGCFDTIMKSAELFPCILAGFTHNDTLMCARYNIAFTDSSLPVSIINQWHWIFGDGFDTIYMNHAPVIHHIFANPGVYDVRLIIHATVIGSGHNFVDTTSQSLVIHPTPLPYFSNLSVCKLQTTIFQDTSNTFGTATTTWKWTFGESYSGSKDTSYLKNPTHKYDSAGVYDVRMIVMNRFGCKDSILKPTRVFEIPTAIFNHTNACSGNPTYFTDKSLIADTANIVRWLWNFGELGSNKDTSMLKDPNHQYKTEGDYLVRLIVKDQHGCYDTVDSTVRVNITPTSSFTYTDNINNMTGRLHFNNKSNGADTYFWDFGNGQTSTDENPFVTYANDGTFLITLVSKNQFDCSDTTYFRYEFIFKGLYIPNAFAPSYLGTGANVFQPVGVNLKQFKIEVFDSWGHMLWSSTVLDPLTGRPTESWDGMDANKVLYPSGTYMWKATATFIDNTIWEGSDIGKGQFSTFGTVTLIR
jgi:PKD repeat protein